LIRPFWSGCSSQSAGIQPFWLEYVQFGRRNLGWSDSGNIDQMLSDFGTGKISVMVDYLNMKVDYVV
jgi:hypothetical protein